MCRRVVFVSRNRWRFVRARRCFYCGECVEIICLIGCLCVVYCLIVVCVID